MLIDRSNQKSLVLYEMRKFTAFRSYLVEAIIPGAPVDFENVLFAASIALLPLFYLTVKNWTETFLIILAALSLYGTWRSQIPLRKLFADRSSGLIFGSLALPLCAVFISIILRGDLQWKLLEQNLDLLNGPSRLFLAGIVFLGIKQKEVRFMDVLRNANAVGIILTLFFATAQQAGVPDRYTTSLIDLDEFSQQMCLLGLLQLLLVVFMPPSSRSMLVLDVISIVAAGKMTIAAGGRGGWIAVPVILVTVPFLYRGPKIRLLTIMFVLVTTVSATLSLNKTFCGRAYSIYTSTRDWFAGSNKPESGGAGRLSMWSISWQLIKDKPLVGYGSKDNLWKPVYSLDPALYLRPGIRYEDEERVRYSLCDTGEHNEYLNDWLINGTGGILSKLSLLLVPFGIFVVRRNLLNGNCRARSACSIGACVVVIFAVHGITQGPFGYKLICSFYGFLVSGLAAEATSRRENEHPCL
jgi:O-antigen ligase